MWARGLGRLILSGVTERGAACWSIRRPIKAGIHTPARRKTEFDVKARTLAWRIAMRMQSLLAICFVVVMFGLGALVALEYIPH
jgi:hypothetical protein